MYSFLMWISRRVARSSRQRLDRIAWWMARLLFDVLRMRRKVVLRNLEIAFGASMDHAQRVALGRTSVFNFCRTVLEFLYAVHHDPTETIQIEGVEHLNMALAHGHGVFIVCTHLGNPEATGAKIGKMVPTWIPAKKVAVAGVNRFLTEMRQKRGFFVLPREKKGDGIRAIRDALAKNQVVGIVVDQTRPGEPKLPFFGHPAKSNTSYAAIWQRVGRPPVIALSIRREAFFEHTLRFLPALELPTVGSHEEQVLAHTLAFNQTAEKIIREDPASYFWMHDRWKD